MLGFALLSISLFVWETKLDHGIFNLRSWVSKTITLVVACANADIGFMVADTLLSSEFELKGRSGPVNGKFHALKVQILSPTIAVAFAGDVEPSFTAIRNLNIELKNAPTIIVAERLFQIYLQIIRASPEERLPDCEFLVLQLTPIGKMLTHVTQNGCSQCERAYIGDAEEYKNLKKLQRASVSPKTQYVQQSDGTFKALPLAVSQGEIEFAEISNALEELYEQKNAKTVGAICGGITRVIDARISGELEYLQFAEASSSLTEGRAGFSVLASNVGRRGIGIYFRAGGMGFLFAVGDSEPCRKEKAETMIEFVLVAKEKYGLNLTGAIFD